MHSDPAKVRKIISSRLVFSEAPSPMAGFTLLEILTVMAIIAMLASFVTLMVFQQQEKSKKTKTDADLKQISTAIQLLETDTGKWPGGCPPRQTNNPEMDIDGAQTGLLTRPTMGASIDPETGSADAVCVWSGAEAANWNGPYLTQDRYTDPWGSKYVFAPDYCDENGTLRVAILSKGANRVMNYRNSSCAKLVLYPLGTDDNPKYLY